VVVCGGLSISVNSCLPAAVDHAFRLGNASTCAKQQKRGLLLLVVVVVVVVDV